MVAIYYNNASLQYEPATSWNMDKVLISCSHFFFNIMQKVKFPKRPGGGKNPYINTKYIPIYKQVK